MALTLGIDASTQSISAVVLDTERAAIVAEASVNFGEELPQYGAPNGFIPGGADGEVHSDPRMWLDALELCLQKLKDAGVAFGEVSAVSGAGQQHGTVYLNKGWFDVLPKMDSAKSLAEQIAPTLSRETSPIWMDTSTSEDCKAIANAVGGDEVVCRKTGSIMIERFSGPQIRRFARTDAEAYAKTARIHLVSSFLANVLSGADACIDHGDGAGMNLLNLQTLDWDASMLEATAEGLIEKLPAAKASSTQVGCVADYFKKRFGFAEGTPVVAFTGDNPSSLVGMGAAEPGKIVISLGTSDTLFAAMPEPRTNPNGYGHVFGNPLGGYMSLVCFLNGSLAREKVRDRLGVDWSAFDAAGMAKTRPGNNGNVMLPFFGPEITPLLANAEPVLIGDKSFTDWQDTPAIARACLEGQFINMWHHTRWLGVETATIYLTGGASQSDGIAQVVADVFNAKVARQSVPGSVALGAALRAAAVLDVSVKQLADKVLSVGASQFNLPCGDAEELYRKPKQAFAEVLNRDANHQI